MSFTALIFGNFRLLPAVVLLSVSRAAVSPDNSKSSSVRRREGFGGKKRFFNYFSRVGIFQFHCTFLDRNDGLNDYFIILFCYFSYNVRLNEKFKKIYKMAFIPILFLGNKFSFLSGNSVYHFYMI